MGATKYQQKAVLLGWHEQNCEVMTQKDYAQSAWLPGGDAGCHAERRG